MAKSTTKIQRRKARRVKLTTAMLKSLGWYVEETPRRGAIARLTFEVGPTRRLEHFTLKKNPGSDWTSDNRTILTVRDLFQHVYNAGHENGKYTKLAEIQRTLGVR